MALAVCANVLMLEDEAGSMCKALTTHADRVCGAFHSVVWLFAIHTCVTGFMRISVGVPIETASFTLDPGVEGSEAVHDHVIGELSPERRLPGCERVCVPNEGCFGVVY